MVDSSYAYCRESTEPGEDHSHVGKRVAAEADLQKALDLLPATAELAIMAREQLTVLAKQPAGTRN